MESCQPIKRQTDKQKQEEEEEEEEEEKEEDEEEVMFCQLQKYRLHNLYFKFNVDTFK